MIIMEWKKGIAIVLISLIIMVPVYVSSVYGDWLKVKRVYGGSNVDNFGSGSDSMNIDVDINSSNVSSSDVYLCSSGCNSCDTTFNYCNEQDGLYKCRFSGSYVDANEGNISFCVKYDNLDDSSWFYVDKSFPETNFDIVHNESGFFIDYNVSDGSTCSGIGHVDIYMNNILVVRREYNSNECGVSDYYKISAPYGDNDFYIEACDGVGNCNKTSVKTAFVDTEAPSVDSSSLKIVDENGQPFDYITPVMQSMSIIVRVNEYNLSYVRADLSDLMDTPYFKSHYKDLEGSCVNISDSVYQCKWSINGYIASTSTKTLTFKMMDSFGNYNEQSLSYSFVVDNDKPKVISMKTNFVDSNGNYWIGYENNTVIADISETGSGLNKKLVFLDLSDVGVDYTFYPSSCYSGWTCEWGGVFVNNGSVNTSNTYKLRIVMPSQDDAGNLFEGNTVLDVKFDGNPPINMSNVSIYSDTGFNCYDNNCKEGDNLIIKVNVTDDDSGLKSVYADLSDLTGMSNVIGDCSNNECEWHANTVSGPLNNKVIHFTAYDLVGNRLDFNSSSFNIAEADRDYERDYFENKDISVSPDKVSRQVTPYVYYPLYWTVTLEKNGSYTNLEMIRATLRDCDTGDYFYEDPMIIYWDSNSSKNIYTIYLSGKLDRVNIPNDLNELDINCSIEVIGRYGSYIVTHPEIQNVSLPIHFEDLALGEITQSVQEKIDTVKSSWLVRGGWIGGLDKLVEYSRKLCMVLSTINAVDVFLTGIDSSVNPDKGCVGVWGCIIKPTAWVFHMVDVFRMAPGFDKYCKFISCSLSLNKWFENFIDKLPIIKYGNLHFGDRKDLFKMFGFSYDPQKSIFSSVISLCLPGIIYNLNKLRQIDCYYIYCMENSVKEGSPAYLCDTGRAYMNCKYWVGALYNLLPWNQFLSQLSEAVYEYLSNPISVVLGTTAITCAIWDWSWCNAYYSVTNFIRIITDIRSAVTNIGRFKLTGPDWCSMINVTETDETGGE